MVQKIQPMGFSGRREEIVAPTVEKDPMARSEMMAPAAPSVLFSGSGYRKPKTTVMTTSSTVSAHSDQASQAAARSLIPPAPRPCFLAPSVRTLPLYSTIVSQALRKALRGRSFQQTFGICLANLREPFYLHAVL